MTQIIDGLLYTEDDEWILVEGDEGTVGISDYAQNSLSDIVYLELPAAGDTFAAGENFGVVESVKAAAELLMPVAGEVISANEALIDNPELVNSDPYGEAWMVKIRISNPAELEGLMDAAAYRIYCDERG
ncbi:MAG: glycine cleavage system protein GcvH [Ardenticatenaceae bacterium]|nr:glycine cleavage system protein GcvH [Ardenticatenaceae bacterium]